MISHRLTPYATGDDFRGTRHVPVSAWTHVGTLIHGAFTCHLGTVPFPFTFASRSGRTTRKYSGRVTPRAFFSSRELLREE